MHQSFGGIENEKKKNGVASRRIAGAYPCGGVTAGGSLRGGIGCVSGAGGACVARLPRVASESVMALKNNRRKKKKRRKQQNNGSGRRRGAVSGMAASNVMARLLPRRRYRALTSRCLAAAGAAMAIMAWLRRAAGSSSHMRMATTCRAARIARTGAAAARLAK